LSQALKETPSHELQDVTCHMRSHGVTCHPTETSEHPTPARGWYSIYLPRMDGRL